MGPTNVALVKLFEADRKLRDAQEKLDTASHNVRIQERRANDLAEKLRLTQQAQKEQQAKASQLDLELKARDQQIEKLRNQQQAAKNNKEYQALLIEINTRKLDKTKVEEQAMTAMEAVEKHKAEVAILTTQVQAEREKLEAMKAQSGDALAKLQADVDATRPERAAAEADVPAQARDIFNRLADRYEGEAMAGIDRPDRRKEEYLCTACNMDLVRDIYNKLKNRNEVVFCPNCQRILFIPEHFTAEHAIGGPSRSATPKKKPTVVKAKGAAKKKAAAPAAEGGAAPAAEAQPDRDVVVIEQRASGDLGKALSKAQGVSVQSAIAADFNPVECEVYVDGELAGIYKGIDVGNLERAVKYYLGEFKIPFKTIEVKPVPVEQAEEAPAAATPASAAAPAATGTEAATPAGDAPPAANAEAQTSESIPAPEAASAT